MISQASLKELQKICAEEFNRNLSLEEVSELGPMLVDYFEIAIKIAEKHPELKIKRDKT